MIRFVSRRIGRTTVTMIAGVVVCMFAAGCSTSNTGVSKEEEAKFSQAPTKQIPPEAQKMIEQKMREAQQKMQQQTPQGR